jgi:hypothetical protein
MKDDSFNLESLRVSPEQIAAWKAEGTTKVKTPSSKPLKRIWCKFDYDQQLALAKKTRIAGYVVQAEIHRLWFKSINKTQPIALGNSVFEELGFNRHAKNRALRDLEAVGSITVEWRKQKSPLVTVIYL